MTEESRVFATFLLRVILGVLFFFQGYDKIFRLKISAVILTFEHPRIVLHLPKWTLAITAYFTSYVEFVCGLMLILGFFKYYALYLLGIDLLLVVVAFSIIEPMWDMRHVFPRIALLLALLIFPSEWDMISLDWLWCAVKQV